MKQVEDACELSPPKEFVCRNSVLTDLWEAKNYGPVFNFGLAVMILFGLSAVPSYYLDSDSLMSHLSIISWAFSKSHICILIWISTMSSILLVLYPAFRFWASSRHLSPKVGLYDLLFLAMYIAFQLALLFFPAKIIIQYDIPIMSSAWTLTEQVRLMMKCHSFVRENAAEVLKYKPHQDGDEKNSIKLSPDFGKLLYFLFAPTLLYRHSYPRTASIRWKLVMIYFLQILGCIAACVIAFLLFMLNTFKNVDKKSLPLETMIRVSHISTLTCGFIIFYLYYAIWHCWMNAFAEMLTFGDRRFYQEWWKCTTHGKFIKHWNMVVHEWLHAYVYRETYFHLCKNRFAALMMAFLVSGLLHDYVLGITLKFGFPLMLIEITIISGPMTHIMRKRNANGWNIFVWLGFLSFWTKCASFYLIEWQARKNCPAVLDPFLDLFVPRLLTCN